MEALLLDTSSLSTVMDYLKPESFYREQHREIFSIIVRMFSNGQQADIITVMNEAVAMGILKQQQWRNIS